MLHTFIDESYGEDDYYVGGVIFTEQQLATLTSDLELLRKDISRTHGTPDDIEFHAHEIMQGKKSWSCFDGRAHESVMVCRKVVHAVVNCGARIHLQGVDVRKLNARYRYPDNPYRISLRHLLERVEGHCKRHDETSTVTADIVDDSGTAIAAIEGYVRQATPGYRPTKLLRIQQPIAYVDSCTSLGIQAADVVTYVLRRHREVTTAHPKALKASRQLFNAAKPNIDSIRKWEP